MDSKKVTKRRSIALRALQSIEIIDLTLDSPIRKDDKQTELKVVTDAETSNPNIEKQLCCVCNEEGVLEIFWIATRKCQHRTCIFCAENLIKNSPTVKVKCFVCEHHLEDEEIRMLLTQQEYSNHVNKESLYKELMDLEEQSGYIPNLVVFECEICLMEIDIGDGMTIRNCLHQFCIDCVRGSINNSTDATVKCPATLCENIVEDREIRSLVTQAEFDKYSLKMLQIVESQSSNSFHCKTPDCHGWAIVDDAVVFFICPICSSINCLSCQVIHPGLNCLEYQIEKKYFGLNDEERTNLEIESILQNDLGMRCPKCKILIMKRDGCDWLVCAMCKTEICWATKQSRWGPRGRGDTSAGCKCSAVKKCSPTCRNCH